MFAAAAVLAPAHIRTVVGTEIIDGILRRRPRRTTSVGGIGICRMARLRRARRNEPTLLGGPLRRIRTIRVLFVRIHAAHYRRKGAAAQRNSRPVRLFFAKAAGGHRLGRMRLSSPRPPHIPHAFVTCAHRLFVAGFRVPHRTSSRGRYKGAESRDQNSVQKACRMWQARAVPKRSGRIAPNLVCKTPGHKVCDLVFSSRIPFRKHVNATFGAHCEQKRERSYNPKRFSSSSLMIFNAFTRA